MPLLTLILTHTGDGWVREEAKEIQELGASERAKEYDSAEIREQAADGAIKNGIRCSALAREGWLEFTFETWSDLI